MLKVLGHRAHAKQLELAWHIDKQVPKYLCGDASRLRQVLVNLIGNAIKFTSQGEIVIDISCRARNREQITLLFCVRDTGIGISPDKHSHVFQAFEQADTSTTRQFGGTGLGLAISARIIEAMNGEIWLDSNVGEGSQFYFTVDLEMGKPPAQSGAADAPDLTDLPIVVVDDNATNRRILKETLEQWGMVVTVAASGSQALAALENHLQQGSEPPILLSDVHMPEMDGFMLAETIRADEGLKSTPIILLTSGGQSGDGIRCEQLGIHAHLLKPAKHSELLSAIAGASGKRPNRIASDESDAEPLELPALKVLLVEDGKANQILAKGMLKKWGHEVAIVENGQQAIQSLRNDSFDVVLMDVQMPIMDGIEATRRIRELEVLTNSHIPIVAMTAHAMKGDRDRCLQAGMDTYVAKPFRKRELYMALKQFFGGEWVRGRSTQLSREEVKTRVVDWHRAIDNAAGDAELIREVAVTACSELPDLIGSLNDAQGRNDYRSAQRAAHTIKSTAKILASTRTVEAATDAEQAAQLHDASRLAAATSTLAQLVSMLLAELRATSGLHPRLLTRKCPDPANA